MLAPAAERVDTWESSRANAQNHDLSNPELREMQ